MIDNGQGSGNGEKRLEAQGRDVVSFALVEGIVVNVAVAQYWMVVIAVIRYG